ncbi:MAG: undecaprenyl-phosphate glucose phosphotransferase [Proteobacteria bacterium]|nr:undecaprenyl-phosphate glucose phosphotransferase [Pseudomonadota bacterium]MBU1648123.1 undecaprenyl-phosphate glucose phosphotransferase [Pseudomonadota bacterium]
MKTIRPEHNYDVGNYQINMPLIVPIIDGLIILCSLFVIGLCYWQTKEGALLYRTKWWLNVWLAGYINITVTSISLFFLFSIFLKVYRGSLCDKLSSCISPVLISWMLTIFTLLIVGSGAQVTLDYSRVVLGIWFITVPTMLSIWRIIFVYLFAESYEKEARKTRTVIIGLEDNARHLAIFLNDTPHLSIHLIGYYDDRPPESERHLSINAPYLGTLNQCVEDARNDVFDLAYLCMPIHIQNRIHSLIQRLSDTTVSVFYLLPQDLFFNTLKPTWHSVAGYSAISVFESPHIGFDSQLKRAEDIFLLGIILPLIVIPLLLIALAIKVSSPGPVLFKQRRYGLSGREFHMFKFRSMTTADDGTIIRQATVNDSRVTPLGKYLRKYSLDELPQFINVLQGDMSIVGPRPHAIAHNEEYRPLIPGYMLRHKVKPGITGLAQISGCRGETETQGKMEDRVRYDLDYIQNWSLGLDMKIILRTIFQVFSGKNVY